MFGGAANWWRPVGLPPCRAEDAQMSKAPRIKTTGQMLKTQLLLKIKRGGIHAD